MGFCMRIATVDIPLKQLNQFSEHTLSVDGILTMGLFMFLGILSRAAHLGKA